MSVLIFPAPVKFPGHVFSTRPYHKDISIDFGPISQMFYFVFCTIYIFLLDNSYLFYYVY